MLARFLLISAVSLTLSDLSLAQCGNEQLAALTTQPVTPGDNVATDGERVAFTARSQTRNGGVSLYVRSGAGWVPETALVPFVDPAQGRINDYFSVDVLGDTVAVGYEVNSLSRHVAIFDFDGQNWTQSATIDAPSVATFPDGFGTAVALGPDELLIGRFVYARGAGGWPLLEVLVEATPALSGGGSSRWNAINEDWIIVGDRSMNEPFGGGVHVFRRTIHGAVFMVTLEDLTPAPFEQFGGSIALDGDLLVIGAEGYGSILGYVATFEFDGTSWQRLADLGSPMAQHSEHYGREVALSGGRLLVSSLMRTYLYERIGGVWTQVSTTLPNRTTVDLAGDTAVYGSYNNFLPGPLVEVGSFRGGRLSVVCPGTTNSTGATAHLDARGSARLSDGSLLLTIDGAPANTVGIFVHGEAAGSLPIGNGVLCIDPTSGLTRFPGVVSTDAAGHASRMVDPAAFGLAALQGRSVIIQFWFRDVGGAGMDWSDAIDIVFCN